MYKYKKIIIAFISAFIYLFIYLFTYILHTTLYFIVDIGQVIDGDYYYFFFCWNNILVSKSSI